MPKRGATGQRQPGTPGGEAEGNKQMPLQPIVAPTSQLPTPAQLPKRVKKEQPQTEAPRRPREPPAEPQPALKRPRQFEADLLSVPSPGRSAVAASPKATSGRSGNSSRRASTGGIAGTLSDVRNLLEAVQDVEGVKEIVQRFPECVLLGGIAARRELLAALLGSGEHGIAASAAALLVAPGMRQPIFLELRNAGEDAGTAIAGPEADLWLRNLSEAVQQGLGNRMKVEPLRLRLSTQGCSNLDVVDLPERSGQAVPLQVTQKIEEMRVRHIGSSANLLVCLEPGPPLDLCRRFDPQLVRTVLLGAAARSIDGAEALPPSELCGPAAARALEDRFAALCHERMPQWLAGLERLELRLSRSEQEAKEVELREAPEEVLRRARAAGLSFGRALQEIIGGAPGCSAGALALEEELLEFAAAAARGHCSAGPTLTADDAAESARELFASFNGVEGYAAYLKTAVRIPGAEEALNGGAAWRRLLAEVEVAMRLASPPQEELDRLLKAAVAAGGTGVHGHQRWEDVASKLMLSIAFVPLLRRVQYVTARVVWVLKHQKAAISEWMSTLSDGPAARFYSPLFAQHLSVLRASPIVRDLVFTAYDEAVATVGIQVLKNLSGTLLAASINPEIMLRPRTETSLEPQLISSMPAMGSGRGKEARRRVITEMQLRSGPSTGLPRELQDRVFDPREAKQALPLVEYRLRQAFSVLADILANQAVAFSDAAMASLCRREVDEAMTAIDFSPEQRVVLSERHVELSDVARQVQERLRIVRRATVVLRGVLTGGPVRG